MSPHTPNISVISDEIIVPQLPSMDMEWAKGIDVNHGKIPTYYQLTDIEFQDLDEDLGEDSWITIDPNTNQPIKNTNAEFLLISRKREKENRKRTLRYFFFNS